MCHQCKIFVVNGKEHICLESMTDKSLVENIPKKIAPKKTIFDTCIEEESILETSIQCGWFI